MASLGSPNKRNEDNEGRASPSRANNAPHAAAVAHRPRQPPSPNPRSPASPGDKRHGAGDDDAAQEGVPRFMLYTQAYRRQVEEGQRSPQRRDGPLASKPRPVSPKVVPGHEPRFMQATQSSKRLQQYQHQEHEAAGSPPQHPKSPTPAPLDPDNLPRFMQHTSASKPVAGNKPQEGKRGGEEGKEGGEERGKLRQRSFSAPAQRGPALAGSDEPRFMAHTKASALMVEGGKRPAVQSAGEMAAREAHKHSPKRTAIAVEGDGPRYMHHTTASKLLSHAHSGEGEGEGEGHRQRSPSHPHAHSHARMDGDEHPRFMEATKAFQMLVDQGKQRSLGKAEAAAAAVPRPLPKPTPIAVEGDGPRYMHHTSASLLLMVDRKGDREGGQAGEVGGKAASGKPFRRSASDGDAPQPRYMQHTHASSPVASNAKAGSERARSKEEMGDGHEPPAVPVGRSNPDRDSSGSSLEHQRQDQHHHHQEEEDQEGGVRKHYVRQRVPDGEVPQFMRATVASRLLESERFTPQRVQQHGVGSVPGVTRKVEEERPFMRPTRASLGLGVNAPRSPPAPLDNL